MDLRYHLLDVFTERPFGGNQLAVFVEGERVPPRLMPLIARELNLSETVFVLPGSGAALRRLRIFTPGAELAFAGHPTVGTACLLALLGLVPFDGAQATIVLQQGVGDVHVRVRAPATATTAWAQLEAAQRVDSRPSPLPRVALAGLLGVAEGDVLDEPRMAPIAASCGTPFLFVPVVTPAVLARCSLDHGRWRQQLAGTWAPHVFVHTTPDDAATVRARMFAPALGIAEDPATGSAATALAALLGRRAGSTGVHRWRLEQGVEMGRPSLLELEAEVQGAESTAARVGGSAVLVGEGVLRLADSLAEHAAP